MQHQTKKLTHCRVDNTPLIKKDVKRSPKQLTKPYYYSAYYFCPSCKRMYFSDEFKVENENFEQFTRDTLDKREFDVEIWTDGACSSNGTDGAKAAWAFVSGEYESRGLVEGKQTNNVAEALAILRALEWAGEQGYKSIKLHTDSQISIHGLMKPPEMVKENREIFIDIRDVIEKYNLTVEYVKVLGHSGNPNNERADRLAATLVGKK